MVSFLLKKTQKKTFDEKIAKFAQQTRYNTYSTIKVFEKFCKEEYDGRDSKQIFEELKTMKGDEQTQAVRDLLQNWIDWMYSGEHLASTVKQYISKIRRYFIHNGVKYHVTDFDDSLEFPKVTKEEPYALGLDEIQKIFSVATYEKIGFYLALISTGARPGELLQVRKNDVDTTGKRIKITIHAENVKTRTGRSFWITKEAEKYLLTKLKQIKNNDLVWATNENAVYAEKNESNAFSRYVDKVGLGFKYKSNKFRKITLYSFRSYFFSICADVHREGYAHKMIGHGGYLPQYDRMKIEKKLEWFLKVEFELVIDSTKRQKTEIDRQKKEITELEIKDLENKKLLDEMRLIKLKVARLEASTEVNPT